MAKKANEIKPKTIPKVFTLLKSFWWGKIIAAVINKARPITTVT